MPRDLDSYVTQTSSREEEPEPNQDLPYFSLTGETKPLPYTEGAIHAIRAAKHGLLPVAEKMEARLDQGLNYVASKFGLGGDPNKTYEQSEAEALGRLQRAREEGGLVAGAAELGGAVFSPLNKLVPGMGGVPKSILGSAAKFGATGAGVGAVQGALNYAGETANDAMSTEGAKDAMATGAMWGGGLGALGGGVLGGIAKKKDRLLRQAVSSTSGDLRQPGKAAGKTTRAGELDKALEVATEGEKRGYIGGFGQDVEETLAKTKSASSQAGAEGQAIRQQLAMEARAQGNPAFSTADRVKTNILKDVTSELRAGGSRLTSQEMDALKEANDILERGLGVRARGTTFTGLNDVHNTYDKLGDILRGYRGDRDFAGSIRGQVLFKVERKLKDLFRQEAEKINPQLAKALRDADTTYWIAQTIEDQAARGFQGELGARPGGGLLGRVGRISGAMLGKLLGPLGQAAGWSAGGKLSQRTVLPNTALSLLRQSGKLPKASRVLGGVAVSATPPSSSGD